MYKCNKPIKKHSIQFKTGEIIIVVNENNNSYLISDENYIKGITISKDEFNSHFSEIKNNYA